MEAGRGPLHRPVISYQSACGVEITAANETFIFSMSYCFGNQHQHLFMLGALLVQIRRILPLTPLTHTHAQGAPFFSVLRLSCGSLDNVAGESVFRCKHSHQRSSTVGSSVSGDLFTSHSGGGGCFIPGLSSGGD